MAEKESFANEEYKKAAEKAMSLLLVQDRTEKGLLERLEKEGFTSEACCFALEYVKAYGYLDDRRFVKNYIEYRKGTKSRKELRYKLLQKGAQSDVIDEILSEYGKEEEEQALRIQLDKKRKGKSIENMDYKEKQKIMVYLARKGFETATIRRMIEERN